MADPPIGAAAEPQVMNVRAAALWAMAGQYASFALQFVTSVVISRYFLSPAEVGLFSVALAAAMLVAALQDFGLSRYVSGLPVLDGDEIARCSSVAFLFSFCVAGLIAAAAWPMARFYHQPNLCPLLLVIATSYLLVPLSIVPMARLARNLAFHRHFAVYLSSGLVQTIVAIALAAAGFSAFALAWAIVAGAAVRGLVSQALAPSPPWPLRLDALGAVLRHGSKSSVLYLSGAAGARSPDLVIGHAVGLAGAGLYSRAVGLSDNFRMLMAGAIGSVFYPAFARIRDRGEPLGPAYLRVAAGYSAILWPAMTGLALASEPLVRILFGPAWSGVAPLLAMIALADVLFLSVPLHMDLPILLGRMNGLLARNIAETSLSIALLALGCLWGVGGAAASRLVYAAAWVCLYAGFVHRLVGFDVRALLCIYLRSTAATVAAVAPLAATYWWVVSPGEIGFLELMLAAAAGALPWFATLVWLRHPAVAEIAGIAAQLPLGSRIGARLRQA